MDRTEAYQLWQMYLDGDLAARDRGPLAAVMSEDGDLRGELLADMELDGVLRQMSISGEEFMASFVERLRAEQDGQALYQVMKDLIAREETAKADRRSRSVWGVIGWVGGLAAAATVLVGVGIRLLRPPEAAEEGIRIVKQIGTVDATGNEYRTGPGSYCRLEYADGSAVFLGENSRAVFTPTGGAKEIEQMTGDMYIDMKKQAKPCVVRSGEGLMELLGTRVYAARSEGGPAVGVLEGTTRMTCSRTRVLLRAGQVGTYERVDHPVRQWDLIYVNRGTAEPSRMQWLDKLGEDSAGLVAEMQKNVRPLPTGLIDWNRYVANSGHWIVDADNEGILLRQESSEGGLIVFGRPVWKKGTVTGRFRVLGDLSDESAVDVAFFYEDSTGCDMFGIRRQLKGLAAGGEWVCMRVQFRMGAENDIVIQTFEFWQQSNPGNRWSLPAGRILMKGPINSMIKTRNACAIGLDSRRCMAEFRDIKLSDAVMATETGQGR